MQQVLKSSWRSIFCLAFAAFLAASFSLHAAESASPIPVGQATPEVDFSEVLAQVASDTALDARVEIEIRSYINDLRRELLDDRMKLVDWWLAAMAFFLTAIAVVVPIAGLFGFKRFRQIENEASKNVTITNAAAEAAKTQAGNAKSIVDEAYLHLSESYLELSKISKMTSKIAKDEPIKADKVVQSTKENPSISPTDRLISTALVLQKGEDIEGAIIKWRAVAKIADETDSDLAARAWFSAGYLCVEGSLFQEAIDCLDKAVHLKPDFADALNARGVAKTFLGQYKDALADYDQAIRLEPDLAKAFANRGNAKNRLGQHKDALADYNQAIRLKPDLAEAFSDRGYTEYCLGRHEDALADHDHAIRLKPSSAEAFSNRGYTKYLLGRHEDALADYNQAIRLKPNFAEAFLNRGDAKHGLGRHDDAIFDYNAAIRLKPDFSLAQMQRAKAHFASGHSDKARQDLEKARELARTAGDEAMLNEAQQVYEQLFGGEES